jgi:hypothetical protein
MQEIDEEQSGSRKRRVTDRSYSRKRRVTDRSYAGQLKHILAEGDISMAMLLGGLGLILWAVFGIWTQYADVDAFEAMFPHGNIDFWLVNYIICGILLWWLVAAQHPPLISLLVGGWIWTLWSWAFFARTASVQTIQIGNATGIIYIVLGILIIQRYGKR